ncbi:MAG: FtsX-like permease family protein [Roseivirga sp.]|nr:FtsX-like permease family protein [Roseivirga sp.]
MWSNYVLTSLRTLQRNKFFVGVNLLSIAVAFSLCTIAYFNIQFNSQFNTFFDDAESIHKVNAAKITTTGNRLMGISPLPLAQAMNADVDGVVATSYNRESQLVKIENQLFRESVAFVDDQFFEVFNFPLLSGGMAGFTQLTDVFINELTAQKLFGDSPALGQTIEFVDANGKKTPFTVAGVIKKLPKNTSFLHGIVAPMAHYIQANEVDETAWSSWVDATFIKSNLDNLSLNKLLDRYLAVQNEVNESTGVAGYQSSGILDWPALEGSILNGSFMSNLHPASVLGTVSSAITVLLLACFNFINTSIAISRNRLKEIGIRKVLGSRKLDLKIQFLVESVIQMSFALALSGLVTMLLVDPYNAMFDFEIVEFSRIDFVPFAGFTIAVWLLTSLLAGMYPAFYISRFKPVEIFKNKIRFSGKNLFIKGLLTFQFMMCVYNVFSMILFTQNAQYQETLDRGYELKTSINIPIQSSQFASLKAEFEQLPSVVTVTGTEQAIGFSAQSTVINHLGADYDVAAIHAGEGYLEALQIRLTRGQLFETNQPGNSRYAIVNQMLVDGLKKDVLNQWFMHNGERYTVIGVVEDFNLKPIMLDNKIEPTVIFFAPEDSYRYANVTVNEDPLIADDLMKEKWSELFPDEIYLGFLQEDVMQAVRQTNSIMMNINGVVAVITLLISALGLYAMVYLNIQSRIKEFGVRKVLGASVSNILYLLNRQVVIMLVIASVMGLVAGHFVISMIMDIVYAYHKEVELNNYIWPVLIIFIIAFAAIGFRVYSSARENPVEQLRVE